MNNNIFNCKWLPQIITLEQYKNNWEAYNKELYNIFRRDFIENKLFFKNKIIRIRINPKENNYEHAFIHLTCINNSNNKDDPNNRIPDLRRCERIAWNRKIIENYTCNDTCTNCKKVLYYEQYYKNNIRINLVFVDAKFKVILEKRTNYTLLITGYYMNYNYTIKKEIERANTFAKQKTPID